MRIEKIRIRGYRSLADLELRPGDFTVLVGPNNSGKSNIVAALDFVSDIYRDGVKLAIERRGGFENFSRRTDGQAELQVDFEIEATTTYREVVEFRNFISSRGSLNPNWVGSGEALQIRHTFSLLGQGKRPISDVVVSDESIAVDRTAGDRSSLLRMSRSGEETAFALPGDDFFHDLVLSPALQNGHGIDQNPLQSLVRDREVMTAALTLFSPIIGLFTDHLSRLQSFQLAPAECRNPAPPASLAYLHKAGTNLPAFVQYLQEQQPDSWMHVMENMTLIVPELDRIDVTTQDRQWALNFIESNSSNQWRASEVSDGTVRALALFATVYDSRISLLAIEEPENSMHSWILRVFINACRSVSSTIERKQVIVTTHSPVVIDHLEPSEIAVVWKESGMTHVTRLNDLDSRATRTWAQGKASLFDILDSGILAQSVPTA